MRFERFVFGRILNVCEYSKYFCVNLLLATYMLSETEVRKRVLSLYW